MAIDISVIVILTFLGGLGIALSPCSFPLLPLFLMKNLQSDDSRLRSVLVTGILCLGILASLALYILLTTIFLGLGLWFISSEVWLSFLSYIVIIILGIIIASQTVREKLRLTNISMRTSPENPKGLLGVFSIGFAYTLVAVPCTGGIFLVTVAGIASQTNPLTILLLYTLLCIAILIPYLAIALVTGEARMRMASRFARSAKTVELVMGSFLILLGLYLILFDLGYFWIMLEALPGLPTAAEIVPKVRHILDESLKEILGFYIRNSSTSF
ncbi:MAG: cytochrome c biogenesis CcdA family protein [Candidatus Thorarchaeota archaeon]